jgi:hypothetical protein
MQIKKLKLKFCFYRKGILNEKSKLDLTQNQKSDFKK